MEEKNLKYYYLLYKKFSIFTKLFIYIMEENTNFKREKNIILLLFIIFFYCIN